MSSVQLALSRDTVLQTLIFLPPCKQWIRGHEHLCVSEDPGALFQDWGYYSEELAEFQLR